MFYFYWRLFTISLNRRPAESTELRSTATGLSSELTNGVSFLIFTSSQKNLLALNPLQVLYLLEKKHIWLFWVHNTWIIMNVGAQWVAHVQYIKSQTRVCGFQDKIYFVSWFQEETSKQRKPNETKYRMKFAHQSSESYLEFWYMKCSP